MRKKYKTIEKEVCTEAIIFARVSSQKQERGASIEAQKEQIYDYCDKHHLKIIKEYEITESTTRGDRNKYNAMLDFIRSRKKKTAIVVNCVDRLQRSDEDNPALNKLRREGKIVLHFMKENIILDEDSPVHDIFSWKMNVLLAGNYTDSLSFNVKRSLNINWSKGKWQGPAPLGYLNKRDEDNNAILIEDPVRAPIIKKLYSEYAKGSYSIKTIWDLAKKMGLYSKMKKRKNIPVSKNTVYDILSNPFYYGEMCIKGKFMPHIYEPLISKELFDKVQLLFITKGNHNRNNTDKYPRVSYAFRGLIKCKECGHLITPETKTKKNGKSYVYLRCAQSVVKCQQCLVNETDILNQIKEEVLNQITLPSSLQKALSEHITKELNETAKINVTIKGNITNKLTELKAKEYNLLDFYLEGKLSQTVYDTKQAEINKEKAELEASAEKYKSITEEQKSNISNLLSMMSNISDIFEHASATQKNQLLQLLFKECLLNGKRLEYTLNAPFDKLIACKNYKSWPTIAIEYIDEIETIAA